MRPSRDELLSAIERLRRQAQADKEMLAYRKNEVAAGIREAEALRTRNAALVVALRTVEWHRTSAKWGTITTDICPSCGETEIDGHAPDCQLDKALRAAEGETK